MPSSTRRKATEKTPYLAIYVLLAAAFMAILNETVMSVAIPVIKSSLAITAETAQWVTTAFLLTMAVVIPVTGFLIARIPLKFLFLISQGLFILGTAIGVFAPNFMFVIVGRVVQACGTAVMLPLLMTTVLKLVPEDKRGQMMGNMSVVIAVAPAIGPTVSGVILRLANNNWHALFETMLPLGAIVLVVGYLLLPHFPAESKKPIDILSVILSAFGFGFTVYALSLISGESAGSSWIYAAVGISALILFVWRQIILARSDRALLDLRVFNTRSFTLSTAIFALSFLMMFGVFIILPLYLATRGVDVLTIGLIVMPGPLIMGLMGPVIGNLYDKFGPRPLVPPGAILLTLGIGGLGFIGLTTPLWWIIACHITLEVGLGLLVTPLFTWGLGDLPEKLYPDGSAIMNTLQQVAGAVGTAAFVTLATIATRLLADAEHGNATAEQAITGYSTAFLCGAALGVAVIAITLRIKPHQRKKVTLD